MVFFQSNKIFLAGLGGFVDDRPDVPRRTIVLFKLAFLILD